MLVVCKATISTSSLYKNVFLIGVVGDQDLDQTRLHVEAGITVNHGLEAIAGQGKDSAHLLPGVGVILTGMNHGLNQSQGLHQNQGLSLFHALDQDLFLVHDRALQLKEVVLHWIGMMRMETLIAKMRMICKYGPLSGL